MIAKAITFFGKPAVIACDAKCHKAWGINNRPKYILSEDEDDFYWFADGELGTAPENPGTYEGECAKPQSHEERLNKWCCRECERCELGKPGELIQVRDLSKRIYNQPHKHPEPKE